jgi:hypothetical protein
VPPGIGSVRVALPPGADAAAEEAVEWRIGARAGIAAVDEAIELDDESAFELRLVGQARPGRGSPPGPARLWPVVRRSLTEAPDRPGAALGRRSAERPPDSP